MLELFKSWLLRRKRISLLAIGIIYCGVMIINPYTSSVLKNSPSEKHLRYSLLSRHLDRENSISSPFGNGFLSHDDTSDIPVIDSLNVYSDSGKSVRSTKENSLKDAPVLVNEPMFLSIDTKEDRTTYKRSWKDQARQWVDANVYKEKIVVSIRGQESSGTNWLRRLINNNCYLKYQADGASVDMDGLYGNKHYYIDPVEIEQLRKHPNHKIIVIIRNALGSLSGLAAFRHPSSFYEFLIHDEYLGRCPPVGDIHANYYKGCDQFMTLEKNVLAYRYNMLRSWINASKVLPDQVHVIRYEDLRHELSLLENHLHSIDGLKCVKRFDKVNDHMKFAHKDGKYTQSRTNKRLCHLLKDNQREIPKDRYQQLLSALDTEFEAKLGYTYLPYETTKEVLFFRGLCFLHKFPSWEVMRQVFHRASIRGKHVQRQQQKCCHILYGLLQVFHKCLLGKKGVAITLETLGVEVGRSPYKTWHNVFLRLSREDQTVIGWFVNKV